jgi:hypothetical protein
MTWRESAPAPLAVASGTQPRMKAKDVIRIGSQTQLGGFERSLDQPHTLLVFHLRELDDENRVLGRETNEHDQADLGINMVLEMSDHEAGEGATDGNRQAEQDAEVQSPALVLRGENQKDKEE